MTQDLRNHNNEVAENLYSSDLQFKSEIEIICGVEESERLDKVLLSWQKNLPRWNKWADQASRPENLPRINRWDAYGNRIEKIELPLETKLIRREVVEQGIFHNKSETEKFAKIYLLAQIGESGVTCPLACTDGLIRVLSQKGSSELKEKYLNLLSSPDYPLAGAQFVTEQSGGSDVGAIAGMATPKGDGSWRINAEKWYCSAYDEFFLIAAKPEGAPSGTRGVAIFFVPRLIEVEGRKIPNGVFIRRLKDKLGTQSLPTAEIDFKDSVAWSIGEIDEGFQNLMDYVLNVSRVHNAANSLGFARRAFAEARNYARQRVAFGKALIDYPLVRETLFYQLAELSATRSVFLSLTHLLDLKGLLPGDAEQKFWQRFLINLCKYRTAVTLTERVKEAIIVFGANGIVQDFSITPRLLRDSLIVETWEGPHNVLCLQILRDAKRFDFTGRLTQAIQEIEKIWPSETAPRARRLFKSACGALIAGLADNENLEIQARRLVDLIGTVLETGELMRQSITGGSANAAIMASYLLHRRLQGTADQMQMPALTVLQSDGDRLINEMQISISLDQL